MKEETNVTVNDVEYRVCSKAIPLLYCLTDVDNLDYKLRSGFRSVRNCSHITSGSKHLVVIMSPELGRAIVCYEKGNFFITKSNEKEDGVTIENITDKVIAVADLI